MAQLKLRYNTEHNDSKFRWRIIEMPKWRETLAAEVKIVGLTGVTTQDTLPDGRVKHHVTYQYNNLEWNGDDAVIT